MLGVIENAPVLDWFFTANWARKSVVGVGGIAFRFLSSISMVKGAYKDIA